MPTANFACGGASAAGDGNSRPNSAEHDAWPSLRNVFIRSSRGRRLRASEQDRQMSGLLLRATMILRSWFALAGIALALIVVSSGLWCATGSPGCAEPSEVARAAEMDRSLVWRVDGSCVSYPKCPGVSGHGTVIYVQARGACVFVSDEGVAVSCRQANSLFATFRNYGKAGSSPDACSELFGAARPLRAPLSLPDGGWGAWPEIETSNAVAP